MSGALLSEVWPDMVQKPKKIKKLKKKTGDPLMNSPLEPDETQYQNNKKVVDLDFNNNIVRSEMMRNIKRESVLSDDPDYQEFLEFKKTRMMKSKKHSVRNLDSSSEEQFNELLLYVFTGFSF